MPSTPLKHIFNELQYELTNKLAEGGMGLVYEAVQKGTGNFRKTVAIKLIREEYSAIPEFQKNFIGEAKLVADLIHTNIVQTYHLGQIGGQYFMTMEFVRGVNLEQFIDRHSELNRPVPIDMAVFIASRVCRGLSYAHAKRDSEGRLLGIVHRDVNPKNVMLAIEGDVKLTDFGIAKALDLMYNEEGKVIPGKDEYLSPEGASYAVTDGRADLFSLGIVLTEILLGKNIFRGSTRLESRRNILTMTVPQFSALRADIDPKLEVIIHKTLQRDRDKRYQSAFEMLTDLEMYLYSDRYGPTNEKLAVYLAEVFPPAKPGTTPAVPLPPIPRVSSLESQR
ncbi:MAG: serine/threonine-protein kinase [bacterium]|nr:serine/threonine-protein kinase [bacterium]MDI1335620.1 serine/threonine-protein kinase [Lacunisphaera sp.]